MDIINEAGESNHYVSGQSATADRRSSEAGSW